LLSILQRLIAAMPRDTTLTLNGERATRNIRLQIHALTKAIPPEVWTALSKSLRAEIPDPADLRLYVAQEIIAAHGGALAVSDDAKAGVLCTITLPLDTKA
jgi:K+-sensing histidine kinase KdpD